MSLFRPRILIIDDDPLFREVFHKKLGNAGTFDINVYDSAVDCILNEKTKPDLIFIDYRMNDMDGITASKMLKNRWRGTQIILVSGSVKAVNSVLKRSKTFEMAYDKTKFSDISIKELRWLIWKRILKISALIIVFILLVLTFLFLWS